MKQLVLRTLIRHRRLFSHLAFALILLTVAFPLMGCGVPTWLSDAGNIIALVGASFTSIASFVAGLTGNVALAAALATISAWITKVQTGISDLETLISQYQQGPSTGLLGEIESSLTDLQQNVKQDFSNLGLPASVLSIISSIAGEAETLLAEWATAITGVKSATTSAQFKAASAHMTDLADSLPERIVSYKARINEILARETGDAEVDAALAKVPKLT